METAVGVVPGLPVPESARAHSADWGPTSLYPHLPHMLIHSNPSERQPTSGQGRSPALHHRRWHQNIATAVSISREKLLNAVCSTRHVFVSNSISVLTQALLPSADPAAAVTATDFNSNGQRQRRPHREGSPGLHHVSIHIHTPSKHWAFNRLQSLSCDVSDALCKLKFRNGGFLSGLTMWSPQRQEGDTKIAGPAYTVQYVPLDDPRPKHPTHYVRSIPTLPLPGTDGARF